MGLEWWEFYEVRGSLKTLTKEVADLKAEVKKLRKEIEKIKKDK